MPKVKVGFLAVLLAPLALAGDPVGATSNLFDDAPARTYELAPILVTGEVEDPGPIDPSTLPLRHVAVKRVVWRDGEPGFLGAYRVSGHSLFDILDGVRVKKRAGNTFRPLLDVFVTVENAAGEKAVFSWGEIYYARDGADILVARTVSPINPSRRKDVEWPLPEASTLVCPGDLLDVRWIARPTRITVRSARGAFGEVERADIHAPTVEVLLDGRPLGSLDPGAQRERRTLRHAGYGHGMGPKGIEEVTGVLLRDALGALGALRQPSPAMLREGYAILSAKDGYRGVFSLGEIFNRSDHAEFLLIDRGDDPESGRWTLFATPDFFVDRNIKAVARVDLRTD